MTRFSEIRHFGKPYYDFGKLLMVYFVFGKILHLLRRKFYAIGLNFMVVNGQTLDSYLVILRESLFLAFTSKEM